MRSYLGTRVILGIRPEDLEDAAIESGAPAEHRFPAVVDIREDMGSEIYLHFGVEAPPVRGADVAAAVGAEAIEATEGRHASTGRCSPPASTGSRGPRKGQPVELVVNTRRLHFFETESGRGIYDTPVGTS